MTNWVAKTTEIYYITILEARSLRSRCQQVGSFWGLWIRICSMPLPWPLGGFLEIFRFPWHIQTSSWSLPLSSHGVLLLYVSRFKFPLFIRTPKLYWIKGSILLQYDLILTNYIFNDLNISIYEFGRGDTINP